MSSVVVMFDKEDIRLYKPKDLDKKKLEMIFTENEEVEMLSGRDIETGIIYIMECRYKKQKGDK